MRGLEAVAVALDTAEREEFSRWCRFFGPRVGVLKVGLEAFVRWGPPAVEEARAAGHAVFLDLKLHDIPNTVAGAVAAARALGVRYLTVHASGGDAMLRAASRAAGDDLTVLAVTVLTSLEEGALRELGLGEEPAALRRTLDEAGDRSGLRRSGVLAGRGGEAARDGAAAVRHRHTGNPRRG